MARFDKGFYSFEKVQSIKSYFEFEPTSGQLDAMASLERFVLHFGPALFVLKGYAGTGKTTLVGAFHAWLKSTGWKSVLLAPTGRAAKVLGSYSGMGASTIHKKIYYQANVGGQIQFTLQANKHTQTIFLVDEASMIGDSGGVGGSFIARNRTLLDDLVDYVAQGKDCKLVLIGDEAQLPPVGNDYSPALDLNFLAGYPWELFHAQLTEVTRQAEGSGILKNATNIRNLIDQEETVQPVFDLDLPDVVRLQGIEIEETIASLYSNVGIENCVVLCRSNKQANNFNNYIKYRVLFQEDQLNAGDLLMVVRNNYYWLEEENPIGFIANGDLVEVLGITSYEEQFGFRFANVQIRLLDYDNNNELDVKLLLNTLESETPSLSKEEGDRFYHAMQAHYEDIKDKRKRQKAIKEDPYFNAVQVKFGYAITCHKSQGGQWDHVFVDQGYLTEEMMGKGYYRWLYTALTRAKSKLYLTNFHEKFYGD